MTRGEVSLAVDSEGTFAVLLSGGGGGSTPVTAYGLGGTVTNAPSVTSLYGPSVQAGGVIGQGVGASGEVVTFRDSNTEQIHTGLSVSGGGVFLPPLMASGHGTAMGTTGVHANPVDMAVDFAKWLWFGD